MTKIVTKLFLNTSILFIVEKPIKYIAISIFKTFVEFKVGKQTICNRSVCCNCFIDESKFNKNLKLSKFFAFL
jgi:hypothetical protein